MILQVLAWVFAASTNCIVGQANDGVLEIGDFVEMSVGSEILGGVAIPEDVVVGAGALVIKTVEDRGSVMGGYLQKCFHTMCLMSTRDVNVQCLPN